MSLQSSADLFSHSLQVFRGERRLLAFPLALAATFIALAAALLPAAFHVSAADAWQWMLHPSVDQEGLREIAEAPLHFLELPWGLLLGAWLLGTFAVTFHDLAFCSQAIRALNGQPVSIRRGYALAFARLPSIITWSLLAGTVGTLMWVVERAFGVLAPLVLDSIVVSRIAGRKRLLELVVWLGVPWTVIDQFVIPVMLHRPQAINPFASVRISVQMIRRLWDDCVEDCLVIGRIGPSALGYLAALATFALFQLAGLATHLYALQVWGTLVAIVMGCFTAAVNGVFRCGMYIYATEGVLPGPFDPDLLRRAWAVRRPV
jgi:hypothetical protein